jgi:hypothetical protein
VNTRLRYCYRDGANYKQLHEVVFAGAITDAERRALLAHLDEGTYFIPSQVGLEDLQYRFGGLNDDDHPWHELEAEDIEVVDAVPGHGDVHDFVARFCATTWDPAAVSARLGLPHPQATDHPDPPPRS